MDSGGPDDGLGRKGVAAIHHAIRRAFGDRRTQHDLDPELFERLARIGRKILWKDGQQALTSLDQYNPRRAWIDGAKVSRQCVSCKLRDGARQFHTGGAATNDDEGLQRSASLRIARALGFFECSENSASDGRGILKSFQAWGKRLPFVMPEISVGRTCSEHERVIGLARSIAENDFTCVRVYTFHFGHQRVHFRPIAEEIADRPSDLRGR
ncbi:hypothetical protein AX13_12185 [Comamonas aquatica DA1877]|uniref:Uncharacterized protein n=1 Tax=Comamonas aquatica DA1877 TaxID=1457173 RepID=A0A014M9T5_9BURK|nr:hypothetical protein AX13_12185 [Comamonas aquatica DA1877]